MRPVAPQTGAPEVTIAEEQPEYQTLTGAVYDFEEGDDRRRAILTRWQPDDADRAALAAGEDVFVMLLTFGRPMQPLRVQVGPKDFEVPE